MKCFVVAVGRCELLWIAVVVVDCCRLLWIVVGRCGVVPSFSKYEGLLISRLLPKLMKMKSVGIRSFSSPYFPAFIFSPNSGKHGPEKIRIRTLFTQCMVGSLLLQ